MSRLSLAMSALCLASSFFWIGRATAPQRHAVQCDEVCQEKKAVAQQIKAISDLSIDNPSALWMLNQVADLELKKPIYRKPWAENVRRALILFAKATKREITHRLCHWRFDRTDLTWIGDNCDDVGASVELLREYADRLK